MFTIYVLHRIFVLNWILNIWIFGFGHKGAPPGIYFFVHTQDCFSTRDEGRVFVHMHCCAIKNAGIALFLNVDFPTMIDPKFDEAHEFTPSSD